MWLNLPDNTIELASGGSAYDATQVQDGPFAPGDIRLHIATTILYPPGNTTGLTSSAKNVTCDGILYISPFVAAQSDL